VQLARRPAAAGNLHDDLRRMVASEADIERQFGVRSGPPQIDVRPGNLRTVEVYRRCKPCKTALTGPSGGRWVYEGIDAREIESVCHLLRVPDDELPRVFDGVRLMAHVAHALLNE
jgi:hypothetical protein